MEKGKSFPFPSSAMNRSIVSAMEMTVSHSNDVRRASKAFSRNISGMAATEFALILPLLLILFLGVVEGSDALTQSRRVGLAVNTLADLAAQEDELLTGDLDDLFDGVAQIVGDDGANMTIRLVSVIADEDTGDLVVHWSRDNSGNQPYAPGADYPGMDEATLFDASASIVVAEITYSYRSKLTHYIIDKIDFEDLATRLPRQSLRVQLCTSSSSCTS